MSTGKMGQCIITLISLMRPSQGFGWNKMLYLESNKDREHKIFFLLGNRSHIAS